MKSVVLQSIEDLGGDRCVDILRRADGRFTYRECRRDPEDSHGWRALQGGAPTDFDTEAAAVAAAHQSVGWMRS